jgi:hypothetical protein
LKVIKITVPTNWQYEPIADQGSHVGDFRFGRSGLSFSFSREGSSGTWISSENDYLKNSEWMRYKCFFCKPHVTYTDPSDVKNEKRRQMKEKHITDSTLVKVEARIHPVRKIHSPSITERLKYPKADYIAVLTYRDSSIIFPIEIPQIIKLENIQVDSSGKYYIKTLWPKTPGKGLTGISLKERKTGMSVSLVGYGLSSIEQAQALTAFKTIKIRE